MRCTYKEGKADGLFESYYANGSLKSKSYYLSGKQITQEEYEHKSLSSPSVNGTVKDNALVSAVANKKKINR